MMQPSIGLVLALAATSNAVSTSTNFQQRHRDLSEMTYAQTNDPAAALLARVNQERRAVGLPPMCLNKKLQAAAQRHVKDQSKSDYPSNFGTDDSTPNQRVIDAGYKWQSVGENIESNKANADAVVEWWMKTKSCDHMLGNYTMTGTAYAYNKNTFSKHFWVQVYATSSTEKCDAA